MRCIFNSLAAADRLLRDIESALRMAVAWVWASDITGAAGMAGDIVAAGMVAIAGAVIGAPAGARVAG